MFEIYKVKEEEKEVIYNLMQIYTYELSFYEDETVSFKMLDNGLYKISKYVDLYWKEEKRHAYIVKVNGELAGFVLERFNENDMNEIAEFFVLHKYRKIGVGTFMANEMFKKYKGKWEIKTLLKNMPAQKFWRKVVKNASNGNYNEKLTQENKRYGFYFES